MTLLKTYRKLIAMIAAAFALLAFGALVSYALVDQYPEGQSGPRIITGNEQVVATSRSIVEIMDRMDANLIGVPQSELENSTRFTGAANVGASMSPDMEIIRAINPDWTFAPRTLEAGLRPAFEAARIDVAFLNLRSINGMYAAIAELGPLLAREDQASALIAEFEDFKAQLEEAKAFGDNPPRVLILMGLPGSYLVATEHSYIGSLVAMTGAINVYDDKAGEFISINTEDMLTREPDIILRAAHALPDEVLEMFDEEFRENNIWRHFEAVEQGRVYDLPHAQFGMSANFEYTQALETLSQIFTQAGF